MIARVFLLKFLAIILLLFPVYVYAVNDAGSRASFTRTGWVGSRYIAMGKAAEVVVNDVFAIYWNPAGLLDLQGKPPLTPEEIKQKAKQGKIDSISEEDLLTFSQDESSFNILQIGASGGMVDASRYAGYGGIAYKFNGNALGIGLYSIRSPDIDTYDMSGNKTGTTSYSTNVGMFSYATYFGDAAVGFTIKGLYERIADVSYAGTGLDIGVITEVIPFLKVGFVIQDIGTGLYPTGEYEYIEKKYVLGSPSIKISSAIISRANNFTIAFSGIKKIEQDDYEYNIGFELLVYKNLSVQLGLNNKLFTTGCTIVIGNCNIGYAFSYDSVDLGYNNFLSVMLIL
ncbi:MAG: hypothetical protein N3F66_02170 [Spirochaetes bacterium]|nr:hypothetical protein [Spirochaetota bacterium]